MCGRTLYLNNMHADIQAERSGAQPRSTQLIISSSSRSTSATLGLSAVAAAGGNPSSWVGTMRIAVPDANARLCFDIHEADGFSRLHYGCLEERVASLSFGKHVLRLSGQTKLHFDVLVPSPPPQPPIPPIPPRAPPASPKPPMPPIPALPPRASADALVTLLNTRFDIGHPSNNLTEAGVLARQFDSLSAWDFGKPWLPCPTDYWCAGYSKIWPASIISAQARMMYYISKAGMLLAPTARMLCVYPGDGNSMGRQDDGNGGCNPDRCDLHGPRDWDCTFTPDHLKEALEAQQRRGPNMAHNELVLDLRSVTPTQLPGSLLAFFYMQGGDKGWMLDMRRHFLKDYGLQDWECPLLHLNLWATKGEAFTLAS